MRLYLVRHAETDYNAEQLALGRADVPLNETGRAQAAALARRFGRERFDAVYASPLRRAVDTATPLADALGLEVRADERLIEMDIGEMEGHPFMEVRERYPDFMRIWLSDGLADEPMPGGSETLREVQARAWAALQDLAAAHPDGRIVVVTHNFVVLAVLCRALGLPLERFRRLRQDLAAVSVIDIEEGRTFVHTMNDACHVRGNEKGSELGASGG